MQLLYVRLNRVNRASYSIENRPTLPPVRTLLTSLLIYPKEPRPQQTRDEPAAAANFQPPREKIGDDLSDNRRTVVDVNPMAAPQRPVRAAKAAAI